MHEEAKSISVNPSAILARRPTPIRMKTGRINAPRPTQVYPNIAQCFVKVTSSSLTLFDSTFKGKE